MFPLDGESTIEGNSGYSAVVLDQLLVAILDASAVVIRSTIGGNSGCFRCSYQINYWWQFWMFPL